MRLRRLINIIMVFFVFLHANLVFAKEVATIQSNIVKDNYIEEIKEEIKTDTYIVKYKNKSGTVLRGSKAKVKNNKIKKKKKLKDNGLEVIVLNGELEPNEVIKQLDISEIEYIQPDYEFELSENNIDVQVDSELEKIQNEVDGKDDLKKIDIKSSMAEIDAEDIIEKISIENKSEEVSTENDMNESNAEDSAEEISEGNNEEGFDTEIDTAVLFDSLEGEIENTSTDEVIVAVIDTGIDIEHSELKNNIWINMKEVEDNIDNDLNLYIDDINGYNFVDENNVVCNAEWGNDMAHATHIAGIIAGKSDANEELKK